jgi:hypothetical protein
VKTVELIVVKEVVVVDVVELVVRDVTEFDVDVSVELMVDVVVAICAGSVSGFGFAKDGEVANRATRKTRITPNAITSIWNRIERLLVFSSAHFLARLMIPNATRPTMIPAKIDSHGKPGIPGICIVLLLNTVEVSVLVLVRVEVE